MPSVETVDNGTVIISGSPSNADQASVGQALVAANQALLLAGNTSNTVLENAAEATNTLGPAADHINATVSLNGSYEVTVCYKWRMELTDVGNFISNLDISETGIAPVGGSNLQEEPCTGGLYRTFMSTQVMDFSDADYDFVLSFEAGAVAETAYIKEAKIVIRRFS